MKLCAGTFNTCAGDEMRIPIQTLFKEQGPAFVGHALVENIDVPNVYPSAYTVVIQIAASRRKAGD